MSEETVKEFNAWLNKVEEHNGWTDNKFAVTAGISPSVLTKARQGILPRWDACVALADAANVPREQAFRAAGLMKPNPTLSPAKEALMHVVEQMDDVDAEDLTALAEAVVKRKTDKASGTFRKKK